MGLEHGRGGVTTGSGTQLREPALNDLDPVGTDLLDHRGDPFVLRMLVVHESAVGEDIVVANRC